MGRVERFFRGLGEAEGERVACLYVEKLRVMGWKGLDGDWNELRASGDGLRARSSGSSLRLRGEGEQTGELQARAFLGLSGE